MLIEIRDDAAEIVEPALIGVVFQCTQRKMYWSQNIGFERYDLHAKKSHFVSAGSGTCRAGRCFCNNEIIMQNSVRRPRELRHLRTIAGRYVVPLTNRIYIRLHRVLGVCFVALFSG